MTEPHAMIVPWRHHVTYMGDGTKRISLSINGRVSLVLSYDPKTDRLSEIPVADSQQVETKDDHG